MRPNNILESWKAGKAIVNGWCAIPSSFSAELMAHQDWDAITIDCQHGLVDCLKRNVIAGAGIDPFVVEPPRAEDPLFALDNIIVSPHSAGNTEESMFRMGATAAQNVVDCFNGKLNPDNVINKEVL